MVVGAWAWALPTIRTKGSWSNIFHISFTYLFAGQGHDDDDDDDDDDDAVVHAVHAVHAVPVVVDARSLRF